MFDCFPSNNANTQAKRKYIVLTCYIYFSTFIIEEIVISPFILKILKRRKRYLMGLSSKMIFCVCSSTSFVLEKQVTLILSFF